MKFLPQISRLLEFVKNLLKWSGFAWQYLAKDFKDKKTKT